MRTVFIATATAFLVTSSLFDMPTRQADEQVKQKPDHMRCLAENIYHESRGEPVAGQVAVAHVTWERAKQSVEQLCNVVWSPNQFSWTASPASVSDKKSYEQAMKIATGVVTGRIKNPVPMATHFHTKSVRPMWRRSADKVAVIGNHVFYRPKQKG